MIGADGESSQAAFGSQAYKRAAFGLSSLSGVHHAVPPSACICDQPHLVHIDGASEGKFDASRCCCGALCPKCGLPGANPTSPTVMCEIRVLLCITLGVRLSFTTAAWRGPSRAPCESAQTRNATQCFDGTGTTSAFFASPRQKLTFEMLIEHVHSTLVTVVPDASS